MNIKNTRDNFVVGQEAEIKGRVTAVRTFGKLSFIVVEDRDSHIQVVLQGKEGIPSNWDIIRAKGLMKPTQKGELSIWVDSVEVIAKCDGDLPNKWEGFTDKEIRYSKRHLDLIDSRQSREIFVARSNIISIIRTELNHDGFIELETPVLGLTASGADAKPFITKHNALDREMHLRIATEVALKKAIIGGMERVFEAGRIFRNEGIDQTHNPEFTSIEIYQAYAGLDEMKELFSKLMSTFAVEFGSSSFSENDWNNIITPNGIPIFEYDDLVSKYGENFDKHLQDLCFVTGQPLEQTPLCKARADGKADRFEVYAKGMELANAYNELTDANEQAKRLNGANDDGLVEAMRYGMPPTGGIGIGIDRLVMYLLNIDSIREVILFPTSRK